MSTDAGELEGPLRVRRLTHFSPEQSCFVTSDTFSNSSQSPARAHVEYVIAARHSIDSVITSDGKKLDMTKPITFLDCGGKLAIVFEGAERPAALLVMGSPDAGVRPTLQIKGGSGAFLTYDFEVKPGQRIALGNLAAPRPLAAYEKPEEAFSGLKTPKDFSHVLIGTPPLANWTAAPPPAATATQGN